MDGLTGIETDTDGMKRGDSTRVKGKIMGNWTDNYIYPTRVWGYCNCETRRDGSSRPDKSAVVGVTPDRCLSIPMVGG